MMACHKRVHRAQKGLLISLRIRYYKYYTYLWYSFVATLNVKITLNVKKFTLGLLYLTLNVKITLNMKLFDIKGCHIAYYYRVLNDSCLYVHVRAVFLMLYR